MYRPTRKQMALNDKYCKPLNFRVPFDIAVF